MTGPMGGPVDGDLAQTKTEARRLVSLLHQQNGISMEGVRSTIARLVELTSSLGVNDHAKTYPSEGEDPSKDRADTALPGARERASGREPESKEAPEEDPQGEDLSSQDGEQWLDDEQWSG